MSPPPVISTIWSSTLPLDANGNINNAVFKKAILDINTKNQMITNQNGSTKPLTRYKKNVFDKFFLFKASGDKYNFMFTQ